MTIETLEYSVCEDCLMYIAYGEEPEDPLGRGGKNMEAAIERELAGRAGHFVAGVDPTEDDEEGTGYEEFSWHECELCRSTLGGSRHGATLVLQLED